MKRFLTFFIIVLVMLTAAFGQAPEKKRYKATRTTEAPSIDGILDEAVWKTGTWMDDFIQNEPYNGQPATQRTEFAVLFDDDNLYVAIKNYDTDPDSIVNRLTRRDQADGDLSGVIFDSFHDLRTGFLFGVSSSGVKYDMVFTEDGQNEDESWDPNWWVKTSINSESWIAEMKIPFSQVRFDKNSGDVWGFEVARVYYRNNETDFWQHIPSEAPGFIHMMGELSGLDGIKPRKIFDLTPYGVAKMETFKKEEGNPFTFMEKGKRYRINGGLDAKIGITNNMTMDLSVNPDFGQVEADPSEVNLTAYETFFSEKRPFFIEGNNITNFNIGLGDGNQGNDNLFYSRRIGRQPVGSPDLESGWYADVPTATTILGAAKLTGKTKNGLSLGFVEAVTSGEVATIDTAGGRIKELVEPLTNFFIGRVQRDFNEGKTIVGGIFTSTNRDVDANLWKSDIDAEMGSYLHTSAYSGGVDFTQFFKDKNWSFNLNTAFSQVNGTKEAIERTQRSSARYYQRPDNDYVEYDPERTSLFGSGGRMQLTKNNGHLNMLACIKWKTPGFETNDLGYMQQADQMLSVIWMGYSVWDPKGFYRRWNINSDIYLVNDFGGDITGKGFEWNGSIGFKNYWNAFTGGGFNLSSLSTNTLRGGPMMRYPSSLDLRAGFSTDYRKKVTLEYFINGNFGFEHSEESFHTEIDLNYKPINNLSISIGPEFSKSYSDLQYVTRTTYEGSDKYIFGSIDRKTLGASVRINFNLTPDLTLQYWGQPYVASGKYYDHKVIMDPLADKQEDRYWKFTPAQQEYDETDRKYYIDMNLDGTNDFSFENNNFNYQFFLSNLVIRWEYNPGSSVYLVWSQSRNFYNESGRLDYFNDLGDLFNRDNDIPHNVFLIKFSYRFGLK
ncbi:MAG: carbohydrate binding family 9 domain-containing protein [Bacteroidales bacterium]|jgi:hypothetical protein|nr:carbohydrate binding family 9 domain-containing protein [Bacteroidales bacterium]